MMIQRKFYDLNHLILGQKYNLLKSMISIENDFIQIMKLIKIQDFEEYDY